MPHAEGDLTRYRWLILALAVASALSFGIRPSAFGIDTDRIYPILIAEDARAPTAADVQVIIDATKSADPAVRRVAVRALGRLERPTLAEPVAPLLEDADAAVRREAANALGQSFFDAASADIRPAAALLSGRLSREPDGAVRGAILQTLGRLEYSSESDIRAAERLLARYASHFDSVSWHDRSGWFGHVSRRSIEEVDGAVRGLSRLFARRPNVTRTPEPGTVRALNDTARRTLPAVVAAMDAEQYARLRRLALQTLGVSATLEEDVAAAAYTDRDWQVRRLAVLHAAALPGGRARTLAALRDPSPHVRFEALRSLGQAATIPCPAVLPSLIDSDPRVARRAAATLSQACEESTPAALERLVRLATDGTRDQDGRWHVASTALGAIALACTRVASAPNPPQCATARDLVRAHAESRVWQTRMYSARSAGLLSDVVTLRRLAHDAHPNVREAAIESLGTRTPREDDPLIVEALATDDYQLVLTAARLLKDRADPGAVAPLRAAFDRLAAKRSDTARDPLTAIREALKTHGVEVTVPPSSPKETPFSKTGLDGLLARAPRAVVTMASGRSFELRLMAEEAPATVARFVQLATRGVYNSLTFHRVEPNFVIQGGSAGANEYAGHDPYMRDEVGLVSHDRGTVGISTRGRDTGDAQLFVNLVDNPRLDHRYTVFARIVSGMEVLDEVVEGDAIARIVIHLQN